MIYNMKPAFIFDWSGTLSDYFDIWLGVCNSILKEFNHRPLSAKEAKETFTIKYMEFYGRYIPEMTEEKQAELYEKHVHLAQLPEIFPGAIETIKTLHQNNCPLFIVSSDPTDRLLAETEKAGLKNCFTEIISYSYKKHLDIAKLVEKHNLPKEHTYYTGDTSGDIEYGKVVGVKTIGISWGFQNKDAIEKSQPDYLIDNIKEVLDIYKKHSQ